MKIPEGFRIGIAVDNGVSPGDPPATVLLGPSNFAGYTRLMVRAGQGEQKREAVLIMSADELHALITALTVELDEAVKPPPRSPWRLPPKRDRLRHKPR